LTRQRYWKCNYF